MRPVTLNPNNARAAFSEIERASHEADLTEIAQNFTVTDVPTAQRTFLGSNVQLSAAGVGNTADTNEDTLFTFSLPSGSLANAGEGLTVLAAGKFANNAHTKTVKLYFGSQVYSLGALTVGGAGTPNLVWQARMTVFKTASSAQLILADGQIGFTPIALNLLTGAETDTAAITIKVTGQSGTVAANDITANIFAVSGLASDLSNAFATFISDCQKGGLNRTT